MLTFRCAAIAVAVLLAGCSPEESSQGTLEDNQGIIGGINSVAAQNSVVRLTLRTDGGVYSCSGTLLAPNLVLTARHCVSVTTDGNVGCTAAGVGDAGGMVYGDYAPGDLTVSVGLTRGSRMRTDGGMVTMVDAGVRPQGMKIFHDDGTNLCNHDLSLLLLDMEIPGALISPIRLASPPTVGETFTAVGWGVTDTTPNPTTRQQRTGVAIEAVGPSVPYDVAANEFAIGEAPCSGDSGGPALDSTTNAIIGVVSRGGNGKAEDPNDPAANCIGGNNIYTQVAPFSDLIMQAFTEAGATPWLEGQVNPLLGKFSAPCASGADCQSNLCFGGDDAGTGFCTSDCTTAVCPTGYDCKQDTALATKVCSPHMPASKSGCSSTPSEPTASSAWWLLLAAFAVVAIRRLRPTRPRQ